MSEIPKFSLRYLKQEPHLMLPEVTSILLVQKLYDILFQYVVTPEKEKQLEYFIKLLEKYIMSKPQGPFSMAVNELEFLEEGLQELKLLNWREIPVSMFEIVIAETSPEQENYSEQVEAVISFLEGLVLLSRSSSSPGQIYVYPAALTSY